MTPREIAEAREIRLLAEHFDRRNMQNAGDAAELKAALEQTAAQLVDQQAATAVEGRPPEPPTPTEAERAELHHVRKAEAIKTARSTYSDLASACGVEIAPEDLQPETLLGIELGVPALTLAVKAIARRVAAIEKRDQ